MWWAEGYLLWQAPNPLFAHVLLRDSPDRPRWARAGAKACSARGPASSRPASRHTSSRTRSTAVPLLWVGPGRWRTAATGAGAAVAAEATTAMFLAGCTCLAGCAAGCAAAAATGTACLEAATASGLAAGAGLATAAAAGLTAGAAGLATAAAAGEVLARGSSAVKSSTADTGRPPLPGLGLASPLAGLGGSAGPSPGRVRCVLVRSQDARPPKEPGVVSACGEGRETCEEPAVSDRQTASSTAWCAEKCPKRRSK